MGVYEDYPKRYPKRVTLFDGDALDIKYGKSRVPIPKPPVKEKSDPVGKLGKDPLPTIASSKPSRIPVPQRLVVEEDAENVISSQPSTSVVIESTPEQLSVGENDGKVLPNLPSTSVVTDTVCPSTGGSSSKQIPLSPDTFTAEKISVATVVTSFDALCNSSTVPLKPIGYITKTMFAEAIPGANVSGNVERIVKEINNAVPLLENIQAIGKHTSKISPAASSTNSELEAESSASPASSITDLSDSCSSTTQSSYSSSASSEMTSTTDTSTGNDLSLLAEALAGGNLGEGDGMVRESETTYYPSETTYFPSSTAHSSRTNFSSIPEEDEDEEEGQVEDERTQIIRKIIDDLGALLTDSNGDDALGELLGRNGERGNVYVLDLSNENLMEILQWIKTERTRINTEIDRLNTSSKNYSSIQLAMQGIFDNCMRIIDWAKVRYNQHFS